MTSESTTTCPRCGAAASGNFCAACGAPLGAPHCASCGTILSPGARFCHKCGTPTAGAERPRGSGAELMEAQTSGTHTDHRVPLPASDRTPWFVAAVLAVVTIAAVVYAANKRAHPDVPSMANAGNSLPGGADAGGAPVVRAPDISAMTPKEQFTRLVARITQALDKGDSATVINFTPMALGAYANLPATDRNIDARYHAAMLQTQVGMFDQARALADTIMKEAPDNLFGYYIRATVAGFAGDSVQAKAARAAFRTHYDAEIKKARPEYSEHRPFLEQYRRGDGAK